MFLSHPNQQMLTNSLFFTLCGHPLIAGCFEGHLLIPDILLPFCQSTTVQSNCIIILPFLKQSPLSGALQHGNGRNNQYKALQRCMEMEDGHLDFEMNWSGNSLRERYHRDAKGIHLTWNSTQWSRIKGQATAIPADWERKDKKREKPAHYHWPAWAIKFKADNKTRAKLHIKLWPTMNREAVIPILFASFILRGCKSHRVSFFLSECLLHVLKGEMTSLIFGALCGPILSGRGRCVLWHSSTH